MSTLARTAGNAVAPALAALAALGLALAALALAAPAHAEDACHMPAAPEIPDGAKATDDEMVAASGAVKAYVSAGDAYIVCLTKLRDAAPKETPKEQFALWTKQHNETVDRMTEVAQAFNEQLRIWKAR